MRAYWLSFVDPDRPKGERFLGVSIVQVSDEEVEAQREEAAGWAEPERGMEIAAAVAKAWDMGCNPGGEVQGFRIDQAPKFEELKDKIVFHQLLSEADLAERGLV